MKALSLFPLTTPALTALALCAALMVISSSLVVNGSPGEILLGQTASFSGGVYEGGILFNNGLRSAFHEVNNESGGVHDRLIKLHTLDDQYIAANAVQNIETLLAIPDLFIFVGIVGSPILAATLPLLAAAEIPVVGPLTGSADFRKTFNPWTLNLRAGYDLEALSMLQLFITKKRYRRVSMIYQNDAFGIPAAQSVTEAMSNMKLTLTALHSYNVDDLLTLDMTAFVEDVLQHRPQGVILFATAGFLKPFLLEMNNVTSYQIEVTMGSWASMREFWKESGLAATSFFQTQIAPSPTTSNLAIAQDYRAAMAQHEPTAPLEYLSMEGYLVGRFTIEALRRTPSSLNRTDFMETVYNTKLFPLDGILAGPFSDDCTYDPGTAVGRSSFCECNQGLRFVSMSGLDSDYEFVHAVADLVQPTSECYATNDLVRRPLLLATLIPATTNAPLALVMETAANTISLGLTLNTDSVFSNDVHKVSTTASSNETSQTLSTIGEDLLLLAGLGGMPISSQEDYPVFPVFGEIPTLASTFFQETELHILATVQQQLFAEASLFVQNFSSSSAHLIISDAVAGLVNDDGITVELALRSSLESEAGMTALSSVVAVSEFGDDATFTTAVNAAVDSTGTTASSSAVLWVLGLTTEVAVDALLEAMEAHPNLQVFITFNDLSLHYPYIHQRYETTNLSSSSTSSSNSSSSSSSSSTADSGAAAEEVLKRLRFATNLPLWSSSTSTRQFVTDYQKYMSDAGHTMSNISNPLFAVGFFLTQLVDFVLVRTSGDAAPAAFIEEFYSTSIMSPGGVSLGPYVNEECGGEDSSCLCNIGPHSADVYTVYNLKYGLEEVDKSVTFSQCQVEYPRPAVSTENSTLIAVATLVLSLLLVAGAIGLSCLRRHQKVAFAPKTEGERFSSMFVSLKNETVLWERRGDQMPKMMKKYTRLVEEQAKANHCYVVKHVGAAILVVSEDRGNMLKCAADTSCILSKEIPYLAGAQQLESSGDHRSFHSKRSGRSSQSMEVPSLSATSRSARLHLADADEADSLPDHIQKSGTSYGASTAVSSKSYLVAFSVGVHHDRGHIKYLADRHAYDYSGPSVDGAALASDKAQGHQILVTNPIIGVSTSEGGASGELLMTPPHFNPEHYIEFCLCEGWGKDLTFFQLNPPNVRERVFKVPTRGAADGQVDSIAANLEQQTTGVTQKKVTVVAMHLPMLDEKARTMSREDFSVLYQSKMEQLHTIVNQERGHLQWVMGARLMVSFNAAGPCPHHLRRALTMVELVQDGVDQGVTAGIDSEFSIVGKVQFGSMTHQGLVSSAGETASLLQRLISEYPGAHCLTHSGLHDEFHSFAVEEFRDFIQLPNTAQPRILISAVRMKDAAEEDEWMYELEQGDRDNEFHAANMVYEKILQWEGSLPTTSSSSDETESIRAEQLYNWELFLPEGSTASELHGALNLKRILQSLKETTEGERNTTTHQPSPTHGELLGSTVTTPRPMKAFINQYILRKSKPA